MLPTFLYPGQDNRCNIQTPTEMQLHHKGESGIRWRHHSLLETPKDSMLHIMKMHVHIFPIK